MNKTDLINQLSDKCLISKELARNIINGFTDIVITTLNDGEEVQLTGFGKFYLTEYKGRTLKNPSGDKIHIETRYSPRFRASSNFRSYIKALSTNEAR